MPSPIAYLFPADPVQGKEMYESLEEHIDASKAEHGLSIFAGNGNFFLMPAGKRIKGYRELYTPKVQGA